MTEIEPNTSYPVPSLRVIPRDEHGLSRKQMSQNALRVLYRLREAGFGGYLVGGAVRDLLVGGAPKDYDVATDATPGAGQGAVPQLPVDRSPLPPGPRGVRARDHRGRHLPRQHRRRQRRPRAARGRAPAARQRLRHHRGRCDPPRLHRQRAVLRHRGFLGARLRRRLRRRAGAAAAPDRRPRGTLSRGPGADAARGAPGGQARLRHRGRDRRADPATGAAAGRGRTGAPVRGNPQAVPVRPCGGQFRAAGGARPAGRVAAGDRAGAGIEQVGRVAPDAGAGPAQYRCTGRRRRIGFARVPVRGAVVAGVLPRAGDAAGTGRACRGCAAPCRRSRDLAPGVAHRVAAPLLAADAGNLAVPAALLATPAQARVAPAGASALPRRLRFPGAAPGSVRCACRGRHLLARGATGSRRDRCRQRTRAAGSRCRCRGRRRGRAAQASPSSPQRQRRSGAPTESA